MLLVVRGTALFITDGFPQRTWNAEGQWLAQALVGDFYIGPFRIYMSLFWFIAAAILLGYVLTQTKAGNWIQASGGNAAARRGRAASTSTAPRSRSSCSPPLMAALAGIISSIRTSAANPNSGTGYELEVIAMVVIGGTALTGGRGTIIGTVLGIFILRVMRNGIVLIGVPGPRLQHLHRRDHPRHDGAAFMARAPAPGGDLSDGRTADPHGEHHQVLRPRAGARGRDLDGATSARSSACSATTAPASRR